MRHTNQPKNTPRPANSPERRSGKPDTRAAGSPDRRIRGYAGTERRTGAPDTRPADSRANRRA